MTEDEKCFRLRTTVRNAVKDWTVDREKEGYGQVALKVKPMPKDDKGNIFFIDVGNQNWCFQVIRGVEEASTDLAFNVLTLHEGEKPIDIDALLMTVTLFHPHHPEMNYIYDSLETFDGQNHLVSFQHKNAFVDGEDSYLDNKGLVNFELQLHVIRIDVFPPHLSPQFKLEMFWANRVNVDKRCSDFVDEAKKELNKKIKNRSAWSSFCEFLRDGSKLASKYQVFSEDQSVITDMLASFFYKEARDWIAPLILDVVHSGYQVSCSDEKFSVVRLNNKKFELQRNKVSDLFVAATKLEYKPLKGRGEFGSDSLRSDLARLEGNGFVMFQMFVTRHLFRMCEFNLDSYESEKGRNERKGYKQPMKHLDSYEFEKGTNKRKGYKQGVQKEVESIVEDESGSGTSRKTMVLEESLRNKVGAIFSKTTELHKKAASELENEITAIRQEHEDTQQGILLAKFVSEMYTKVSIDVAALYDKSDPDCTEEKDWASINKKNHKKHNKSKEDAKAVGKIGEKLAKHYLTKKYEADGWKVFWLNDGPELGEAYDFALCKENEEPRYFEVKITGIPDKYWFKMSLNQIECAFKKGHLYSVVFIKVNEDSSADFYEVQEPLSKPKELQPILMMRKDAKGLDPFSMRSSEVLNVATESEINLVKGYLR